jgi:hypothetical protein
MPYIRIEAASVRAKALATAKWSWLNRILGAWLLAMLALCLSILTFAAVREMSIECRREPSYLRTTERGDCLALEDGGCLLIEEKRLQCRFAWGDAFEIAVARMLERL